tara:strand:+ start:16 stop:291 length:276 start_codon:yes stop_codon:yes gene_type:complete
MVNKKKEETKFIDMNNPLFLLLISILIILSTYGILIYLNYVPTPTELINKISELFTSEKIIEKSIDIPQPPISITNELANELYNNNDVKLG